MATLDTLLNRIVPFAPGLSDLVAKQYMLVAARKFCEDTLAVSQDIALTTSSQENALTAPADLELCGILRITSNGRTVWAKSGRALDAALGTIDYSTLPASSAPTTAVPRGQTGFVFVPAPSTPQSVVVTSAVKPALTATTVPDVLVSRWYEALISGALAELMVLPGQSYTNVALAAIHEAKYKAKRNEARIRLNDSDSLNGTIVRGPSFTGR